MKFENRILVKILIAFLLAWTLFLVFVYQSLISNLMSSLKEHGEQGRNQLQTIFTSTGQTLLDMSQNISDLVFEGKTKSMDYKLLPQQELNKKLEQSWKIFANKNQLLTMNYYDKTYQLLGSWGISTAHNQIYASQPNLLKAFEARIGSTYFSCQDICYYHATRAFYPNSFEYGILHFTLPIDEIVNRFRSLNPHNISVLQQSDEMLEVKMLNEDFRLQTSTRLLEYYAIKPLLDQVKIRNKPYLLNNNGALFFVYAFNMPDQELLYLISRDITTQVNELHLTFGRIISGSFLVVLLMTLVLWFSLHRLIARLNKIIKILPTIGKGHFAKALEQLMQLEGTRRQDNNGDEINVLYNNIISLNQQLENLHSGFMYQNERLRHLAEYDALTGIYNRRKFKELMTTLYLERRPFLLVYFDMDHFKLVNDTFGHAAGDELLLAFVAILKNHSQDAIIGRMGGDEFAMLLLNISYTDAHRRFRAIVKQMEKVKLKDSAATTLFSCIPSIGVACYPSDTCDLDELAACADAAMYENKRRKQDVCAFYTGKEVILAEEKQFSKWINLVLNAIEQSYLCPYFQPIACAHDREIIAYEALARIIDPNDGVNSAEHFITYTEHARIIVNLDYTMLDRILHKAHLLNPQPCLMINLSNLTMEYPGTVKFILDKLAQYNYNPSKVVFELTESYEVKNFSSLAELMSQLRKFGVRFALDDFGTGYSSFSYISHLKFDILKIDKTIINGLLKKQTAGQVSSLHLIESIVSIAQQANIITVAEGIESPELLAQVTAFKVDWFQGYLFGKPQPEFLESFSESLVSA